MKFILSLTLLFTSLFANISYDLKTQCFSSYNSNLLDFSGDKVHRYYYHMKIDDNTLFKNIYEHNRSNKIYGKDKNDILLKSIGGYDYNYHIENNQYKFSPKYYLIDSKTLKKVKNSRRNGLWHEFSKIDNNSKSFQVLFNDGIRGNLSLMIEYYEHGMKKVKEKNHYGISKWVNGKFIKPSKYVTKEYFNPKLITKIYPLTLTLTERQNAICEHQFQDDLSKDNSKKIIELLLWIGGVAVTLLILFGIYKLLKSSFKYAKNKKKELVKDMEDRKVRKIAEEESIRESVKKSMSKAEDDELTKLQDLINSAVAKGDSETAQTLLELLNKKKEHHNS